MDLSDDRFDVWFESKSVARKDLLDAIRDLGFDPEVVRATRSDKRPTVRKVDPAALPAILRAHLEQAAQFDRLVLLQFLEPGWMVSTRMDTVTYPDSRVQGELNRWVTARIDVSQTPEVARLCGVAGVPTAVALTPDGRILGSKPNFVAPEAFEAWLRSVRMLVPVE